VYRTDLPLWKRNFWKASAIVVRWIRLCCARNLPLVLSSGLCPEHWQAAISSSVSWLSYGLGGAGFEFRQDQTVFLFFPKHRVDLWNRPSLFNWYCCSFTQRHAVAKLVEALRYKPEGRGYSFRPHCGPGFDSATNRGEYQEYFLGGKGGRCLGLETLPPSCDDCLEIWEPQPPGTLRFCPGL
jgi:hypothetical protein